MKKVLTYLSEKYQDDLTDASLEQYAATDNLRINKTIESVKFDLYFTKYLSDTLVREYFATVIRFENGNIVVP